MIYCYNCGKKNDNNVEFCKHCNIELFHGTQPGMMATGEKRERGVSNGVFYTVVVVLLIPLIF